jgi:hypothetical protein
MHAKSTRKASTAWRPTPQVLRMELHPNVENPSGGGQVNRLYPRRAIWYAYHKLKKAVINSFQQDTWDGIAAFL